MVKEPVTIFGYFGGENIVKTKNKIKIKTNMTQLT